MNVICFGDSNTYGYDPRGYLGSRYDSDCRWVDLLAAKTGWSIQNQGMNGREIPIQTIGIPENTDLLIIMLGTNDLLQGRMRRNKYKPHLFPDHPGRSENHDGHAGCPHSGCPGTG